MPESKGLAIFVTASERIGAVMMANEEVEIPMATGRTGSLMIIGESETTTATDESLAIDPSHGLALHVATSTVTSGSTVTIFSTRMNLAIVAVNVRRTLIGTVHREEDLLVENIRVPDRSLGRRRAGSHPIVDAGIRHLHQGLRHRLAGGYHESMKGRLRRERRAVCFPCYVLVRMRMPNLQACCGHTHIHWLVGHQCSIIREPLPSLLARFRGLSVCSTGLKLS